MGRCLGSLLHLGEGETKATARAANFDYFAIADIDALFGFDLLAHARPRTKPDMPRYYTETMAATEAEGAQEHARFRDCLAPMLPVFRQRYRRTVPARERKGALQIAVHVRRGDVGPDRADMFTHAAAFAKTIADLTKALKARGIAYEIAIFSQGEGNAFDGIEGQLFLDSDPFDTMRRMIDADVLIMSKSCFSYVAALLGEGLCIFEECDLPAFEGWLLRDATGAIDAADLAAALDPVARPPIDRRP